MIREPILIAGAGALGSVIATMLKGAGHQVALLGRRAHLEAIAAGGLRISGLFGERQASGFTLAHDASQLHERFALILLTAKSYDTAPIADQLRDHLTPDGVVVSLQNGLGNVETLRERFGATRVLGGKVILGAEFIAPGSVRATVIAEPIAIGPAPGSEVPMQALFEVARELASMLERAGVPAQAVVDIVPTQWVKLFYNTALNPLGALLGLHYGALAESAGLRTIMDRVIGEVFAVACAREIALPFASADEYRELFYGRLIPPTFHHRPSMLYDLTHRGRTEIGALNARVVEFADAMGVGAEANRSLTILMRAAERRRRLELGGR